jgi:cysteine-rich repeat protein
MGGASIRLALASALTLAGCFGGDKACQVPCGADMACPVDMTCLGDRFCHNAGDEALCSATGEDLPAFDAPPRPDAMVAVDAVPLADAAAGCGNGVVELGEECDDGNLQDDDACMRCAAARCGDGVLRAGFEQCDDGNFGQQDGCTTLCLSCGAGNQVADAGGHCYTRHDELLPFEAASLGCGYGSLMGVPSRLSQDTVFDALLVGTMGPYWFGLHDRRVEGYFEYVTFEPVTYTDWNSGQPDNKNGQDCAVILVGTSNWNDATCSDFNKFVCEDDGAWIHGADGHGYRVVWGRASYDEAVAHCAALGAHLATLTGAQDHALVFGSLPVDGRIDAWLGADDRLTPGAFAWVTGEPFLYHGFAGGQPDGDGDCLAASPGLGGWSAVDCASKRPFVCELDPPP